MLQAARETAATYIQAVERGIQVRRRLGYGRRVKGSYDNTRARRGSTLGVAASSAVGAVGAALGLVDGAVHHAVDGVVESVDGCVNFDWTKPSLLLTPAPPSSFLLTLPHCSSPLTPPPSSPLLSPHPFSLLTPSHPSSPLLASLHPCNGMPSSQDDGWSDSCCKYSSGQRRSCSAAGSKKASVAIPSHPITSHPPHPVPPHPVPPHPTPR